MVQDYFVYRQVFKFKVAYFVLTETEASNSYVGKNAMYAGRIHAMSKEDAANHLKRRLDDSLAHLDK